MLRTIYRTGIAAAIISTFSTSAFAEIDAKDVFDQLVTQLKSQGATLEANDVSVTGGDDVILKGVSISFNKSDPIKFDEFLLQDVIEAPDDAYIIGRMGIPGFERTSDDNIKFVFGGAVIEGLFLAGPNETDPVLRNSSYYRRAISGPVTISTNGQTIFSAGQGEIIQSEYLPGGTIESNITIDELFVDFSTMGDEKSRQVMKTLGYEQIKGDFKAKGSWDTASGLIVADTMTFSAQDAADLSIRFEVDGYTPELAIAVQELQVQALEKGAEGEQQRNLAMFGMMQQLEVKSASITIDDNSLTGRLLDYFGAQQGMNRESTIAFAKGTLPLGLAQLGNPDFAAKASAAVGQFLDDPQNLTILAMPANPVSFAQIAAAFASNPASLIDLLSVKVEANQ